MKKLIAMLLAMLMVIGLFAGCAGDPAATTPSESTPVETNPVETDPVETEAPKDPVTLTWWTYESEVNTPLMEAWADRLHEAYPWITIEWTWLPFDTGPEKMTVAFATETYPDIISDTYGRLAPAVDAGLTINLQPAIDMIPGLTMGNEGWVGDEPHYIWQGGSTGYSISCNMDLAAELGIEEYLPDDGMTWGYDEFLACLRAAKAAGYYGIDLYAGSQSSDMWYYTFFFAAGGEIIDIQNKKVVVNEPAYKEANLKVLNLLKTIVDEGLCQPGAATMIDQESQPIWFTDKMLFCHGAWSNVANWVKQYEDGVSMVENFEMFSVPSPEGGEWPKTGAFSSSGVVAFDTADGAKLDAIYTAIAYFYSEEGGMFADFRKVNPAAASILEHDKPITDGLDEVYLINQQQRGNMQATKGLVRNEWGPAYGWYADFRLTFYPQLQNFYSGNITAEQLLETWQANAQAAIDDWYAKNAAE